MTAPAPAVFMDRDGTLIEEAGYLDSLERLALFPSTVDALRLLGRAVAALTMTYGGREPAPTLAHQAAADLGIDAARSWMIGDRWGDVQPATNAGMARGILVRTGYGRSAEARPVADVSAAFVADDVMEAASWIFRRGR